MRALILLFVFIMSTVTAGQTNTCATATPFIDNSCIQFSPARAAIQSCYTFTSPADSIEFTFTAFVPQNTCQDAITSYTLYDQSCGLISTSSVGLFTNLQPGNQYVVCYTTQCPTTGVITLLCTTENIVLPVQLIYLTAESTPTSINVIWGTASEQNCSGFFLERSTDLSGWVNIGFVEGMGNSQQLVNYYFEDKSPVHGVNYYRLTQYDLDGDFEILQTIAIMWNRKIQTSPFRYYNFLGQKTN
jgi:hypothetical protein